MKKFFVLIAALIVSTCSGPNPVITPSVPTHSLSVHVVMGDGSPVPSPLIVHIDDSIDKGSWTTNVNGDIGLTLKQAGFTIYADPPSARYGQAHQGVNLINDQTITLTLTALLPPTQSIHLQGTTFRTADGKFWNERKITAFDLMNTDFSFLDWAHDTGFNSVRVLTTAAITTNLPPQIGEAKIGSACDALRQRGMGAEFVLLADTATQNLNRDMMTSHVLGVVQQVQDHCSDLPISFEIANENAHPSQQKDLQDISFLQALRGDIKTKLPNAPVSLGSTCCGQPDTIPAYGLGGDFITLHLDRSRTPFWDEVRRIKDLIDTQSSNHQRVSDDEGMGANETDEPGRRSANPTRFFVQGVLDRLGELGSTFHCDSCVTAVVPGPIQQQCAKAYIAGATIVPDDQYFVFHNDSTGGATNGANWSHVEKLFTFENTTGGQSYVVALNVTGDLGITWANGWRQIGQLTLNYPGIQILEISK